jgi:hypothetical protein
LADIAAAKPRASRQSPDQSSPRAPINLDDLPDLLKFDLHLLAVAGDSHNFNVEHHNEA